MDNTITTEKELDTVEVLKAIQKAKDVKFRMNNSDKKVRAQYFFILFKRSVPAFLLINRVQND